MNFKEMIASDIDAIFLNPDEFGEEHKINGRKVTIIVDDYTLEEQNMADIDKKSARSEILFYINAEFFRGKLPRASSQMNFDGRNYRIDDVRSDMGMLAIKLGRRAG